MAKKRGKIKVDKGSGLLLREAISDINKELSALEKEKNSLKSRAGGIDREVENAQAYDKALQEKRARLLEKEAALNKKKKDAQERMDSLADKLAKIKKVKSEIGDI